MPLERAGLSKHGTKSLSMVEWAFVAADLTDVEMAEIRFRVDEDRQCHPADYGTVREEGRCDEAR